jgi:hypothetical protein
MALNDKDKMYKQCLADTFNMMWQAWFVTLRSQMPELGREFDNALCLIETASKVRPLELIHSFCKYTQTHLRQLFAEEDEFLRVMVDKAAQSEYELMPQGFMEHYTKLDSATKSQVFGTLKGMGVFAAKYDPNFGRDFAFEQKHAAARAD